MRYLSGGESHGPCLTGIIEGLPAGLALNPEKINYQLERRQRGYGRGGRMNIEKDRVEILSGLRFNNTIGSPFTMQIKNRDWGNWQKIMSPYGELPADFAPLTRPRPGHADLAGGLKYNHEDLRLVLERSSARETAMRVAVGSVGRIMLEKFGFIFFSQVTRIGSVNTEIAPAELPGLAEKVEKSPLRCADALKEALMIEEIDRAREEGDTLGGIIELYITGVPPGLGSHVFWDRRLDGRLCGALGSIQGIKGVEIGAGFSAAAMRGKDLHDPLEYKPGAGISRPSNNAGGIEGGISNGQPLVLRLVMKPIPTLSSPLASVDLKSGEDAPGALERSDVCAVPSAAVVAEAAAAWELAVAFREKFSGDFMEEIETAYNYYLDQVNRRLRK
ncbi:MAG: chorismate synthase [Bacillota bacterium]